MQKTVRYIIIFITAVLLQVLLFDNLNLSPYVFPLVYTAFILWLPMNISHAALILYSLILGVSVDLLSGIPGLNTIASLASGFIRPVAINISVSKDFSRDSIMPLPYNIGNGKWLRYAVSVITVHCLLYFFFEAASFRYAGFTLLRAAGSIVSTTLLIWIAALLIPSDN